MTGNGVVPSSWQKPAHSGPMLTAGDNHDHHLSTPCWRRPSVWAPLRLCRAKLSAKAAELLFPVDDQAARRYSLMAPPRTRCRRTGALIGTTVPGSWSGGRLSRL